VAYESHFDLSNGGESPLFETIYTGDTAMNALELLKEDHRKVEELFEEYEKASNDRTKFSVYNKIRTELEIHTKIEETIVYPAFQKIEELEDMVMEALEEHKQVKDLIREIDHLVKGSEKLEAKIKVMKEDVEHHVKEEEGEVFPKVESLMDESELEELGTHVEEAKKEMMAGR